MATPLGLALENSQKIDLISHPTHFPIKAYRIHYKGSFSQIRQGLLLLPENQDNKPLPSLVYLHGHGSSALKAAFDETGADHAVGAKAASQGMVVFLPDLPSFEKSNGYHYRFVKHTVWEKTSLMDQFISEARIAQDILETVSQSPNNLFKLSAQKNMISGLSLGGLVALAAGSQDNRFEWVGIYGQFLNDEMIHSNQHHSCQHQLKIPYDNPQWLTPRFSTRTLHIIFGEKDEFFGPGFLEPLKKLTETMRQAGQTVCLGPDYQATKNFFDENLSLKWNPDTKCSLVIEIDPKAGHEIIGLGKNPEKVWNTKTLGIDL